MFRKACKNDCKYSNATENPIVVDFEVLIDNTLNRAAMFFFRPSLYLESTALSDNHRIVVLF